MKPGRVIETVLPCGIVVRSPEPYDVCAVCAADCPAAGHDGRSCTGGCKPCTCGEGDR